MKASSNMRHLSVKRGKPFIYSHTPVKNETETVVKLTPLFTPHLVFLSTWPLKNTLADWQQKHFSKMSRNFLTISTIMCTQHSYISGQLKLHKWVNICTFPQYGRIVLDCCHWFTSIFFWICCSWVYITSLRKSMRASRSIASIFKANNKLSKWTVTKPFSGVIVHPATYKDWVLWKILWKAPQLMKSPCPIADVSSGRDLWRSMCIWERVCDGIDANTEVNPSQAVLAS